MKSGNRQKFPQHRWLLLLVIFILISMACSIPGLSKMTPSPEAAQPDVVNSPEPGITQETGSPGESPSSPQVDLAPALVEVDPQPLSELNADGQAVFYFNQAMDRASVEAAFQAQPSLTGRFDWLDDATMRFVPDELPGPNQEIALVIQPGARAVNGLNLPDALEIRYRTPGQLRVANLLPSPDAVDVDPSSAIVASFNRPVVSLGVDSANLPVGFTLEPATGGRGEWINTSTYIFYPQPALFGGVAYTVRINAQLAEIIGVSMAGDSPMQWSFTTAAPQLVSLFPETETPLLLDTPIVFGFNQPMDQGSVENNFSLLSPQGSPVDGVFSWNDHHSEMTFQPNGLLARDSEYTIILIGSAASQGGTTLGQDMVARVTTFPALSVWSSVPRWQGVVNLSGGYGTVTVNFSTPLKAKQDWKSLISLDPAINDPYYYLSDDGLQLTISGFFAPSKIYDLSISTDVRDRWDGMLDQTFYLRFSTSRATPSLTTQVLQYGYPAIFVPQGEVEIPARATNVSRVSFSRGAVTLVDFIEAAQNYQGLVDWQSKIQASWVKLYYLNDNATESIGLPMTASGAALDPGLYFLKIEPTLPGSQVDSPPALLVVSPIQMVVKIAPRQAFAWAVNVADTTPAKDALVSFYDSKANILGTCATDDQGVCQAEIPLLDEPYSPVFAVIGQPGDPNFSLSAVNWNLGVGSWDFGLPFEYRSSLLELYLYTDRPIYRPGQTVHLRAVARDYDNGRYSLSEMTSVSLKVDHYDQDTFENRVIMELNLPMTSFGTASGDFILPEDISPGLYYLSQVDRPGNGIYFEVAEYRKPEIHLDSTFARDNLLNGDDLTVGIKANYFFGAPAGNLPVRWVLYARDEHFPLPGNLSSGRLDTSWGMQGSSTFPWGASPGFYVIEGEGKTNPDGTMVLSIKAKDIESQLQSDRSYRLTLEITARDESGLPVSVRTSAWLHPANIYIGVRPEAWVGVARQETVFYVRTMDWHGNPVGQTGLKAGFYKVRWVQEESASGAVTFLPELSDAGSTDFTTSDRGEARLSFLPPEPGTYMLEITQRDSSDGAVTQHYLWVSGEGSASWPNFLAEHMELLKDSSVYEPGQTARIFIPNPLGTQVLALITVERGKVMQSMVVPIEGSNYILELPLTEQDAPNVYISALLLGRMNNRPGFRVGLTELTVNPKAELLDVVLETAPQQLEPGGEVTVTARVRDSNGSPVQGEFSLAVVDQAVLALADPNSPGIVNAFYGRQPLGVSTGLSLAVYPGRSPDIAPGRGGAGGDQVPLEIRDKFEDTAYWIGTLVTDIEGVGQVTFTLPDNLTTWQVDTRGITIDSKVGEATTTLVINKPLLVRPVTPRFVVLGDHLELAAVVHNNTQQSFEAEVSLDQASGFQLDDAASLIQVVSLQPGERKRVGWWGTVKDADSLDLVFSIRAGNLRDSTRPERGSIPVLRYAAPQTFRTAGVLTEAGERIESIAFPRSFTPEGGGLRFELTPTLAGVVLNSLDVEPYENVDLVEPVVSHLIVDLSVYRLAVDFSLRDSIFQQSVKDRIDGNIKRLERTQNPDGGWGWATGQPSDPYVSTYVLYGLGKAAQAGLFIPSSILQSLQTFLVPQLIQPSLTSDSWALDRLAFQYLALQQVGWSDINIDGVYQFREKLSPWGKALLAMAIQGVQPQDERARTLLSDLQTGALRYSTGAHWQGPSEAWRNWTGLSVTTAAVVEAIAKMEPSSPVLLDAVRYLVWNRMPVGVGGSARISGFEAAWVTNALAEVTRYTEDFHAGYDYTVNLNGAELLAGRVEDSGVFEPINSWTPASIFQGHALTALQISRSDGTGRLYYNAALEVARPVENAPASNRGISITRSYYVINQDCKTAACQPVERVSLQTPGPLLVRLVVTIPEDMANVAVEDWIPAGTEILNPRLKTSQQGGPVDKVDQEGSIENPMDGPLFDPSDPLQTGWGWWLFGDPSMRDDHIRWVAEYLPAGTYVLTYRLDVFLPGEFRVLPAHAWQMYFPEIEGSSAGGVLLIEP